jgi:hypothetical protein
VAWSGFGVLKSWFLRLCHCCVMSFKWYVEAAQVIAIEKISKVCNLEDLQ